MRFFRLIFYVLNNFSILKNIIYAVKLSGDYQNWTPIGSYCFKIENGKIISKDGDSFFKLSHIEKFNNSARNIDKALKIFKITEAEGTLFCSVKQEFSVLFEVNAFDNIAAAIEVFYDRVYNLNYTGNSIVFDVGANIGIASLYFACNPSVEKVYAYEPFDTTCKLAKRNISLNPAFSQKITLTNSGLSDRDQVVSVPEPTCGFMGASTTASFINTQSKYIKLSEKKISLNLIDIYTELKEKLVINSDRKYILKLDCEGAEYEIINRLKSTGMLQLFNIVVIEWHYQGSSILIESLKKCGFMVVEFPRRVGSLMGLIYAFKNE